MLVLSRRSNQSIMIGPDIRLTVLGFDGDQVKLGIEAPRDVSVHRCEIYERIHGVGSSSAPASRGRVGKGSAGDVAR